MPKLASCELQNGSVLRDRPATGTVLTVPRARPGGLRMPTKASAVPETSARRQACVRPVEQRLSPVEQSVRNRLVQAEASARRCGLPQA